MDFPIIFGEALLHLVAIIISFYFGNSAGSINESINDKKNSPRDSN